MIDEEKKNPWRFFNLARITLSDKTSITARFMKETESGVFVDENGVRTFYAFSHIERIQHLQ